MQIEAFFPHLAVEQKAAVFSQDQAFDIYGHLYGLVSGDQHLPRIK
jgi:hypothetical protein